MNMSDYSMLRWLRKQPAGERRKAAAAAAFIRKFTARALVARVEANEIYGVEDAAKVLGFCKDLEDVVAESLKPRVVD